MLQEKNVKYHNVIYNVGQCYYNFGFKYCIILLKLLYQLVWLIQVVSTHTESSQLVQ